MPGFLSEAFELQPDDQPHVLPVGPFGEERDFNRRIAGRKRSPFHVSVRIAGVMEMARGVDVSETGLAFYSSARIAPGERLEMVLCPSLSGPRACVRGTVRHARGGKVGVQFECLTLEERSLLLDAVALSL